MFIVQLSFPWGTTLYSLAAPRRQSGQRFDQYRASFLEIHLTGGHNPAQNAFALGTDTYKDETAVTFVPLPMDEAALFEAIDQFDRAVMTKTQAFGQITDRRFDSVGKSFQHQEEPVLSRMKAHGARGVVA